MINTQLGVVEFLLFRKWQLQKCTHEVPMRNDSDSGFWTALDNRIKKSVVSLETRTGQGGIS